MLYFFVVEFYTDKDNDDTRYCGVRGVVCKEEQRAKRIMGSYVCEKYFNLCSECATTNNEGDYQTI